MFRGRPILWLAAVVISLIPAAYTAVYLGAFWDPYGNLNKLPAGLVTLDRGTEFRGKNYNLGERLIAEMKERKPFKFVEYQSEQEAEVAVRSGELYFALVVPSDFSRRALPGTETASLELITSQGTSFIATLMAERFGEDAAVGLNHELGVGRWKVVLSSGLRRFLADIPTGQQSAEDLTESVLVERRKLAPVSANGPGFAPYFMSLSLWIGVLLSAFLFHLIVFPKSMADKKKMAKVLGKGAIPLLISLVSAVLLGLTVQFAMRIPVIHLVGFYTVLLIAALTYSAIILSLVRLIGDAGKLLSVFFLVVQISSAGGAYPIELSPRFYQVISPWLPLTHVVGGIRAAMFGSYNGEWVNCVYFLLPWIFISLCLSLLSTRRFRYVEDGEYGPALDLSF